MHDEIALRIAKALEKLVEVEIERNRLIEVGHELQHEQLEGARRSEARMQAAFEIAFAADDGTQTT